MPYFDSLDIANRVCQLCGVDQILSVTEDSKRNFEIASAYDKVRRAELRRNTWRFAVRSAALRAIDSDTLLLVPAQYNASKTYLIGEVVQDTNGAIWVCNESATTAQTPGGNNENWDMYFGPMTADRYNSGISYNAGELVYVLTGSRPNGYQVFISLISNNSDAPNVANAYDATVQYKQDDVVSYGGQQWRSLLAVNLNNTPAAGPLAWASGTTYSSSQQVTGSDNYIYTSVSGGNVGNDPTTDNGANWTNTGSLTAWSNTPAIVTSSKNWRPITATLKNVTAIYPLGAGPSSQSGTRNVFRLPAGYLRAAAQNAKGALGQTLGGPTGLTYSDWVFDGEYIVSASSDLIILRFVADVTKVRAMDDMFCEGLAARVATAVCQTLTQSGSKLADIASAYNKFMGEARSINAIEAGFEDPPDDDFITVRA